MNATLDTLLIRAGGSAALRVREQETPLGLLPPSEGGVILIAGKPAADLAALAGWVAKVDPARDVRVNLTIDPERFGLVVRTEFSTEAATPKADLRTVVEHHLTLGYDLVRTYKADPSSPGGYLLVKTVKVQTGEAIKPDPDYLPDGRYVGPHPVVMEPIVPVLSPEPSMSSQVGLDAPGAFLPFTGS